MKMSVTDFKSRCTQVLREVAERRYQVEVTNRGKVVAVVRPPEEETPPDPKSYVGRLAGTVTYLGDIVQPLDEDWDAAR